MASLNDFVSTGRPVRVKTLTGTLAGTIVELDDAPFPMLGLRLEWPGRAAQTLVIPWHQIHHLAFEESTDG